MPNVRDPFDIIFTDEKRRADVAVANTERSSGTYTQAPLTGGIVSGEWLPVGRFGITQLGEFRLSSRRERSVSTRRYGYISGAVANTDFGADEANLLGNGLEDIKVVLSDLFAVKAFLKSTHYNATIIGGQLALTVSRGALNVADNDDEWRWVVDDEDFTLDQAGITTGTIAVNVTNYFFLNSSGEWEVKTTNVAPTDAMIAFSAVANAGGTEFTSANNLPTGRVNFDKVRDVTAAKRKSARRTITANRTLDETDEYVYVDTTAGAIVITLPLATYDGPAYRIKKISNDANTVTVQRAGADTIDGATSKVWSMRWEAYDFASLGGTAWGIH